MISRYRISIIVLIASALFICYLVSSSLVLIVPLYLKFLGFSTAMIGLLVSISSFARVPVAFFAGYLSDTVGRFKMLVIGCLLTSIGILMLIFPNLLLIIIGRILFGMFGAFITPILWSYVSHVASTYGRAGKLVGLMGAVTNAASVVSYSLSGVLIDVLGFYYIILILSIMLISVILLVIPVKNIEYEKMNISKFSLIDVLSFVKHNSIILILCLCCLLEWYVVYSWLMLTVLYMKSLNIPSSIIGIALTIETLIYTISQSVMGHIFDRLREKSLIMLTSAVGYAVILMIIPYLKTAISIMIALVFLALVSSPISVTIFSMISIISPLEKKSSIMGLMFTFGYMGVALGTLLSGVIASISYVLSYSYLSIPLIMIASLGLAIYLKLRRSPRC